ncbi:MAG: response regulator [Thermodesulfobacteriota bacterium]|nr:response regulator [Thermodesulfobacteriota bacterium]
MLTNIADHSSRNIPLSPDQLLRGDEVIAVVEDDPIFRGPLKVFLEEHGLSVKEAGNAQELLRLLDSCHVALVLLDIGLPDIDGLSLLPRLVEKDPELGVVMLTSMTDLQTALDCIRKGADDYLTKPVQLEDILHAVTRILEKRRLIHEKRRYEQDLEKAHFRIRLMHQLSLKMNSVYLSMVELDEILQAILIGITANQGLRFNRAFLAIFNQSNTELKGRLAIGATNRERAGQIWAEMDQKGLNLIEIVNNIKISSSEDDAEVNRIVKGLKIPVSDSDHILIKSAQTRRSIKVLSINDSVPVALDRREEGVFYNYSKSPNNGGDRRNGNGSFSSNSFPVPHDLINLLGEKDFVVVPLFSPGRALGVIIADNFVTGTPIYDSQIRALELFASQASLAIEHSHLYRDMQKQIVELESLNNEVNRNKDMLVQAERYSAIGHMAAQLVHAIRNPITSIGGVSRILARKITDAEWGKYVSVMIKETDRLESTLEDLFAFVSQSEAKKEPLPLFQVIKKTIMLVQIDMVKQHITWELDFCEPEPVVDIDLCQVRQMILHLLKNSIEAMPDGGKLTVTVMTEGDWVSISIRDTGSGIPDSHMDKATDPFFTTKMYGTGMGLTMVERVVKMHNGSMKLNRLHTGMDVVVKIPPAGRVAHS